MRGRRGLIVGFTTIYAISAYHHLCEFESQLGQGVPVLDTTFCDKVCQ